MTFREWLSKQLHRQDAAGVLAQALDSLEEPLPSGRQKDEHKRWAEFIVNHGTFHHVLAFNEAWQEFLATRDGM